MIRARTLLAVGALLALIVPATAWTETEEEREEAEAGALKPLYERPLDQAREESGVRRRPRSRFELPAGELRVSSEVLAASQTPVRFRLDLDRPAPGATVVLRVPRLWLRRGVSGLPFARLPGGDRTVVLDGSDPRLEVENVGIPAGTYRVPYAYRRGGRTVESGVARIVLYAPVREQHAPNVFTSRLRVNATNDIFEESEAFIAAMPGNSDRVIAGINSNDFADPCCSAWISGDRGQTWAKDTLPSLTDAPGIIGNEVQEMCGDPMHAADEEGNLWYGNLTCDGVAPSRIVVNRVAAGGDTFQSRNVGLKFNNPGQQDKNLMAIDNSPSSPTYGRLYVVWGEPAAGGGVNVVIVECDTKPTVADCDDADNWSAPATVAVDGSFIYADVSVGPDGKVYVTWWDYSANNAIRGDVCDPNTQDCSTSAAWAPDGTSTIATLDATGAAPIPFSCPILAQPGGRASPAPQVEVSRAAADSGRVYVTWSDLRAGSGATRCDGDTPFASHLSWDSFVASAGSGAMPGGASPSTSVGTRLLSDGESGGAANSDDWFPWLAVDQGTGQAYADFYSTRDDPARQTTHFYMRAVTPSGADHELGALTRVSTAPSDYSDNDCCEFGNDYGDYEGLDAAEGAVFPVWTDNSSGGDGEAFTIVPTLALAPQSGLTTESAGDGDGVLEPGESGSVVVTTVNASTVGGLSISGALSSLTPDVTVTQGSAAYPDLRATKSGDSATAYTLDVAGTMPCNTTATLQLAYSATQEDTGTPSNTGGDLLLPVVCPPGVISGLSASGLPSSVLLDWADTLGATTYNVFRRNAGGTYPGTPTNTSLVSTFTDSPLTPGTEQCYRVQATNPAGDGPQSSEACATPTAGPPPPPPDGQDVSGPSLRLGGKKRQRIARNKTVTVTAICLDEACGLSATGAVSVPGAARSFRLRGTTSSVRAGVTVRLKLRLKKKTVRAVVRALRAGRKVTAKMRVTAVDAVANARTAAFTVRARR